MDKIKECIVRPSTSLNLLSHQEIIATMETGEDVFQIFRDCALAVLNTGNETDAAIEGNGFFILGDGENRLYTRAGLFDFDALGNLISKENGLNVMGIDGNNSLSKINIATYRTSAPTATTDPQIAMNAATNRIGV